MNTHRAIDVRLMEEADAGNHEAVRVMARAALESLTRIEGTDGAAAWLADIMERIAEGQTPDEAFGWRHGGKPKEHRAFLEWTYARWVGTLIDEHGVKPKDAKKIVGRAASKSWEDGGTIAKAWTRYGRVPIPDDIYPLPDTVLQLAAKLDERMVQEIARLSR